MRHFFEDKCDSWNVTYIKSNVWCGRHQILQLMTIHITYLYEVLALNHTVWGAKLALAQLSDRENWRMSSVQHNLTGYYSFPLWKHSKINSKISSQKSESAIKNKISVQIYKIGLLRANVPIGETYRGNNQKINSAYILRLSKPWCETKHDILRLAEYRFICEKIDYNRIPSKCHLWCSKFKKKFEALHHKMKQLRPIKTVKSWKPTSKLMLTAILVNFFFKASSTEIYCMGDLILQRLHPCKGSTQ